MTTFRFRAATVHDALRRVERELGPAALIVRTEAAEGAVEVVAVPGPPRDPLGGPWRRIVEAARAFGLAEVLLDAVATAARQGGAEAATHALARALRSVAVDAPACRKLALVGPTGVGKTTTIGKLAARDALAGRKVLIVSTDTDRPGTTELLAAVAERSGAVLATTGSPAEAAALARRSDAERVLIDTAGVSPRDPSAALTTAGPLAAATIPIAVCLAAGTAPGDARVVASAWRAAGARLACVTKWDETATPGSALSAIVEQQLALVAVGVGRRIPGDLVDADPLAIAACALALDERAVRALGEPVG